MILKTKSKAAEIYLMAGQQEIFTIESLAQVTRLDELKPAVEDGRFERWLQQRSQNSCEKIKEVRKAFDNNKANPETFLRDLAGLLNVTNVRVEEITVGGITFKMIFVKGGTFTMGATPEQENEAFDDEKPAHIVELNGYYIGEVPVTQALWQAVMGSNPSYFKGEDLPVEQVSWEDCQTFVKELRKKTDLEFRLPTEAEWEYAARGGKESKGYKYSGSNNLDEVGWYDDNSGGTTHPVKQKKPNELGIYDMSGNVWEWCEDWFGNYSDQQQKNPNGPQSGSCRVGRGGGWFSNARGCRVSNRNYSDPSSRGDDLGLRLVLVPKSTIRTAMLS